ncbi:MAG TPA: ATP-binding protein [bacterium]
MTFELAILFLAGIAYLLALFLIAYSAERGWIPSRIARQPLTYVLSLGVYATSWTYYGSVGFAQTEGYGFLTIYLGVTLAFALTPVLLMPILRITREYQLTSLADLFAFRYRSHFTGLLVTVFMLVGILPYISLQILAVTASMRALSQAATPSVLALGFCVTLILFAILFGARHASVREKHEGLVVAIAFESAVKLLALGAVGLFAAFGLFREFGGLPNWLTQHPEAVAALYKPMGGGPWVTLMVLSFAAAFLLPRQFHMTFTENIDSRTLSYAAWGFPLFLLLLNLPIVPILWGGDAYQPGSNPDYYVLTITLNAGSGWLPTVAFLGGVSAASAMMIVETLALAAMCLNHIVLPMNFFSRERPYTNLYQRLLWWRRFLIAVIILAGYGFYLMLESRQSLVQLGLISFVAVAQFLPGVIGLLFWPRATRSGFIVGLLGGGTVWSLSLLIPLLQRSGILQLPVDLQHLLGMAKQDPIAFGTFWSLAVNSLLYVAGSVLTRPTPEEAEAARACTREILPPRGTAAVLSPQEFTTQLTRTLGSQAAEREVRQALGDLKLPETEQRPAELRRLRERIEKNLSGLIGPLLARWIMKDQDPIDRRSQLVLADRVHDLEGHLEESRSRLQGLAAELDGLRRYHRRILLELPQAVFSLGPDQEIVIWNHAMERVSGLAEMDVGGRPLSSLTEPWNRMLSDFVQAGEHHVYKRLVTVRGRPRWFNLHKAAIDDPFALAQAWVGLVILVEDLTDRQILEAELAHSERLASIGRLAAGVAHEIGNPLTGIASLAQNLAHEDDPGVVQESMAQIQRQIWRISDIVQSLVTFAHGGLPSERERTPVALAECAEEAMRLVRLSRVGKQITFLNRCDPDAVLDGERNRLVQLFVNLFTNSCDASQPGDTVEVLSRLEDDLVRVEVVDQGTGIPEELHERVFEPFFTTKQPGEGTGLGLPLVYNIVTDHGGSITIDSSAGRGTRVILRLPTALNRKTGPAAAAEARLP